MQLLKYMACIWAEYEKTFLDESGRIIRNKSFKYPPIIPVVYYEGEKEKTADMRLRDRVMFSDILRPYIPDFKYIVVRNHDFSDEELLSREDEMSLLMLINKFQTADDISNFKEISKDKIDAIIQDSPEAVIDIIASVVKSLCTKIHISAEETDEAVRKVREHKLGYLFENMEKIDIQELRRIADEERLRAEVNRKEAEENQKRAEENRKRAEENRKRAEENQKRAEENQKRAEENHRETEEERRRIKRTAFISIKCFLMDIECDLKKIESAIYAQEDTNKIVEWIDNMEQTTDKMKYYKDIIGEDE